MCSVSKKLSAHHVNGSWPWKFIALVSGQNVSFKQDRNPTYDTWGYGWFFKFILHTIGSLETLTYLACSFSLCSFWGGGKRAVKVQVKLMGRFNIYIRIKNFQEVQVELTNKPRSSRLK